MMSISLRRPVTYSSPSSDGREVAGAHVVALVAGRADARRSRRSRPGGGSSPARPSGRRPRSRRRRPRGPARSVSGSTMTTLVRSVQRPQETHSTVPWPSAAGTSLPDSQSGGVESADGDGCGHGLARDEHRLGHSHERRDHVLGDPGRCEALHEGPDRLGPHRLAAGEERRQAPQIQLGDLLVGGQLRAQGEREVARGAAGAAVLADQLQPEDRPALEQLGRARPRPGRR